MNALPDTLSCEPRPAVCAWCGAWFHTSWGAAYDTPECGIAAYDALQSEKSAAARLNELQSLVSRGILDADALEIWAHGPTRDTDALAGIRDKVLDNGRVVSNAWLSGGPGTGKTFACLVALLSAWEHGQTVAHVNIRRLLRDGDRGPLWQDYLRCDV